MFRNQKEQYQVGRGLFNPLDVISTNHLLRTQQNECQVWMKRIYFSNECRYYYLTLISLTSVCIVWSLLNLWEFPEEPWFQTLEIFLSFMMFAELVWKAIMQGWGQLLAEWENVFDFMVMMGSVGTLGVAVISAGYFEEAEGLMGLGGIAFRNIMMYMRLIVYLKNQGKTDVTIIDLNDMSQISEARQIVQDPEIQHISPDIKTELNHTKSRVTYKYLGQENPDEERPVTE
jgi:hypothetical protein